MKNKAETGVAGEELACIFLKRKGYVVIDRNRKMPGGEIDIIARSPDRTIVFVEVKTLSNSGNANLMPEDNATRAKLQKMRQAAMLFAGSGRAPIDDKRGWRIDLIAIVLGKPPEIRHYENV